MIALSPFGFGEICYRDFEIFLAGAALAKPSMEHLSTYPDFFKVDTTYISFAWDFSDLDQRIDTFLSRPEKLLAIASKGQELLLDFRSREGQEAFCSRLVDMLELAR